MTSVQEVEAEVLRPEGASSIQALEAAAVDQQIATAKRYPRDVSTFLRRAREMIGEDKDLAGEMGFELERGGKAIVGPSVRLAEVALNAWGNVRVNIVDEPVGPGDRALRVYATAHDLETNVAIRVPVVRRITTREGKQYGDDLIQTTYAAAVSIAFRNATFRIVPRVYVGDLYREAMKVAAGEIKDMPTARKEFVAAWAGVGLSKERLFAGLGIEGIDAVTHEHLGALRALYGRVKRGEVKVETLFVAEQRGAPSPAAVAKAQSAQDRLVGNPPAKAEEGAQQPAAAPAAAEATAKPAARARAPKPAPAPAQPAATTAPEEPKAPSSSDWGDDL